MNMTTETKKRLTPFVQGKTTITLPAQEVHDALSVLKHFVCKDSLAGLDSVLITIQNQGQGSTVGFTATNLDGFLTYTTVVPGLNLGTREFMFDNIASLTKVLKNPVGTVTFHVDPISVYEDSDASGYHGSWTYPKGSLTFSGKFRGDTEHHEFLRVPPEATPSENWILFPGFRDMYKTAIQFSSTDTTRYILNGVHIHGGIPEENQIQGVSRMISTNGRFLVGLDISEAEIPEGLQSTLPYIPILSKLTPKVTGNAKEYCVFLPTSKPANGDGAPYYSFHWTCGPWTLHHKGMDGQYPQWSRVIPALDLKETPCISFPREQIKDLLDFLNYGVKGEHGDLRLTRKGRDLRLTLTTNESDVLMDLTGIFEGEKEKWEFALTASTLKTFLANGFTTLQSTGAFYGVLEPIRMDRGNDIGVFMPCCVR